MVARDYRGSPITGADHDALDAFERALANSQSWQGDPESALALALAQAPGFVMAHVLRAGLQLCSREPTAPQKARAIHNFAATLDANERERAHLAAIDAAANDDYDRARSIYSRLLADDPRDVLALQVAHAFDYLTGDSAQLAGRVPALLRAWSAAVPGYHAVLSMHAFGLEESADYDGAIALAFESLELNAFDARAHHVLAHVYEMTVRPEQGLEFLRSRSSYWESSPFVATHTRWHAALYHLEAGCRDEALAIYDASLRPTASPLVADMIDASALLWRIHLAGGDTGNRFGELAQHWASHIEDGFCTFTDLHAMMAFVGACEWRLAERMLHTLSRQAQSPDRHGATTRQVGLPAGRALAAFGRGDCVTAVELLGGLPGIAARLGGSQAQRDFIHLTLVEAVQRIRPRPQRLAVAA